MTLPTPTLPPPVQVTVEAMLPPPGGQLNISGLPFGIGQGHWDTKPYYQISLATVTDVATTGVDATDHVLTNYFGINLFVDVSPAAFVGAAVQAAHSARKTLYFLKIFHGNIPIVSLGVVLGSIDVYRVLLVLEK